MRAPFFNKVVIFIILGLRPLFGIAHCRYVVSCTQFARWAVGRKFIVTGGVGTLLNVFVLVIHFSNPSMGDVYVRFHYNCCSIMLHCLLFLR